jgi:hypothetical protein
MTQRIDIRDQRFHSLTVIEHVAGTKWRCLCDCGKEVERASLDIRTGKVKSCGCRKAEAIAKAQRTHGMTNTATYRSWISMRRRCYDKTHPQYKYYGGAGVKVCERWRDDFAAFLEDMGERPQGKTLDRKDRVGDYEPTNCRWATQKEQMNNTSRSVKFEGKSLTEWSNELNIKYATLSYRLRTHGTIFL